MNNKTAIIKTATQLFSSQGYEATTTLQIAREVGVTEPAVFYHFKNKNTLFSAILKDAVNSYLDRITSVDFSKCSFFECFKKIISVHFAVVADEPHLMRILLRTCPARLQDPNDTCAKVYSKARLVVKK